MSLATRLAAVVTRIGTEFKTIRSEAVLSADVDAIRVVTAADYAAMVAAGTLDPRTQYLQVN